MGVKPTVVIKADGKDITDAIMARLSSLTLSDNAGDESDKLTLELQNADEALEAPPEGRVLEVFIGYDGDVTSMGQFVVDEVSASGPPSQVTIEARSTPFDADSKFGALQTKKRRSFDGATVQSLVSAVAASAKLEPVVASSLASVSLGHVDQTDESDIHLLSRVASDLGAIVKPAFGKLLFLPAAGGETASGQAIPPITIKRSQVSRYTFNKCKRELLGSVVAVYRDASGALDIEVKEGDGEPSERMRFHFHDQASAQAAAKGRLFEAARGSGTVSVTLPGDPQYQAEAKITLEGFPLAMDGAWTAKRVEHSITPDGGWIATIEGETGETGGSDTGGDVPAGLDD